MKRILVLSVLVLALFSMYGCASNNDKTIPDLTKYLKQAGFRIEDEHPKLCHMVGAEDGIGLKINGCSAEIYKYNTENPTQKSTLDAIKAKGTMQALGISVPVEVNGSFVIIIDAFLSTHPDKDKILEVFSKF